MNSLRKRIVAPVIIASLATMLSACGGGSGSGSSAKSPSTDGGAETVTKSFTVSLDSVQVNRASNGDAVDVDTSEVSSSGSLTTSE